MNRPASAEQQRELSRYRNEFGRWAPFQGTLSPSPVHSQPAHDKLSANSAAILHVHNGDSEKT